MAINKVFLLGNVGRDPEVLTLESGRKVARFSLATTDRYTDKNGEKTEVTEWHAINAWDKKADLVEKYVKAGAQLCLEGRIKSRAYQDKSGAQRTAFEIVAEYIQPLGRKDDAPAPTTAAAPAKQATKAESDIEGDLPWF